LTASGPSRDVADPRVCKMSRKLLRRGWRSLALAGTVSAAVAACGSSHPSAPKTSALPLAAGLKVARSVGGLSGVDTGTGRHYRYMVITGRRGTKSLSLLRYEVRRLKPLGWRLQPIIYINNHNQTTTVGIAHHGVVVVLNGPHDIYVALQYLTSVHNLDTAGVGPGGSALAPLNRKIRNGIPMLGVVMGHRND
jgi:hypothetical protein